jgi:hypothetical protein
MGTQEHPMAEIDVEIEQIYARVVTPVGGLFRGEVAGPVDRPLWPHFRSDNEVNMALSSEV